jgi:hypothetical protein
MSLSIAIQEKTIENSGNTYDHREYLKTVGGKWDDKPGHNQTKCGAYAEKLKQDNIQLAVAASKNLVQNFQMLKETPYCSCGFEEVYEYDNIWRVPVICRNCYMWCCEKAEPNPKIQNNPFDFICPCHGSSME